MRNYLLNVHNTEGAHLQCVNNNNAKFECKGMKTVGVTDYINQTSILEGKMLKFHTPQK